MIISCLLIIYSNNVKAEPASPFLTYDQNPLTMIYGLPLPAAAKIINQDQIFFSTSLNISNTINIENDSNEFLYVDAEIYQLNLLLDYGFKKDWMLRLRLPVVALNGGFLDSWIDNYHELLHLPEHIRPHFQTDQFRINYRLNDSSLINLQQRTSGIGDLSIQVGHQITSTNRFNLSVRGSLKLPTGDARKLTGSDSTDLALWLSADKGFKKDKWVYGNMGLMLMSNSKVMRAVQKNTVLFANAGFQMHPWENILLKLQLDTHNSFYDSHIDFLGPVMQLTFGGTILFESSSLDIAVAEDIKTQASPDVTFHLNWKIQY